MKIVKLAGAMLLSWGLAGCGEHRHDHPHGNGHGHHHEAPHGGTLVVLGDEEFHLEFLHDQERGAMQAFILDGHAHQFIRLPIPSFRVLARFADREEILSFNAVAQVETGETIGNTAMFQAEADWLKDHREFNAVLEQITIRGRDYSQVHFPFPEGNE
jgi:hypothetical protein